MSKFCIHCMNPIEDTDKICPSCMKGQEIDTPGHHLLPGTVLNGKYLVGSSIGEGGFGITYIGRDIKLDIKVAVKEYFPSGYVNRSISVSPVVNRSLYGERKDFFDKGCERFLKEAQILAKFSGERGIVFVRDFFEENNTAYIVMEFLDGENLKEFLERNGRLLPEQTVQLLMPVMQSLSKVHKQGLIHRDISPDNIMLIGDQVKLLDFGAARDVSNLDKSLSVLLKPGYAPEEQYRSKGIQGPWTDIYALCATMYKCITGITPDDSAQRVFNDELKRPSELGINISPALEAAIMKGLSIHREERYQTIDEFINGLNGFQTPPNTSGKTAFANPAVDYPQSPGQQNDGNYQVSFGQQTVFAANNTPQTFSPQNTQQAIPAEKNNFNMPYMAESANNSYKKAGKKKRFLPIALTAVAVVVVAIIGLTALKGKNENLGTVTICGEEYNRDEEYISIFNETVTADDIKAISSFDSLNSLSFYTCTIEDNAMQYLKNISSELEYLTLDSCTGISDYSSISGLKTLKSLTISECDLTNEQLTDIGFKGNDCLEYIYLDGNESLSDISSLSSLSDTLSILNVDGTSVCDFSELSDFSNLSELSAIGNGITDISSIASCSSISSLCLDENNISDISAVGDFDLNIFSAVNNNISDISALSGKEWLYSVDLDGNSVSDLTPLSEAAELSYLAVNDNLVESLEPLAECMELTSVEINRNKLTNLDGLEKSLELKTLEASGNQIDDIGGLTNCTVLENVDLSDNSISDITILKKSYSTLKLLSFDNNKVSNLLPLDGMSMLNYLSFDNNSVTTLEPLKSCVGLLYISADNNKIVSTDGLENAVSLKYICLSHNLIEDITAISNLVQSSESVDDFALIDLSSNDIREISLTDNKNFDYLSIYNNPIEDYDIIGTVQGSKLLFSYESGMDLSAFGDAFTYFEVIDCPLDKQIEVRNTLVGEYGSYRISFSTVDEADQEAAELKAAYLP